MPRTFACVLSAFVILAAMAAAVPAQVAPSTPPQSAPRGTHTPPFRGTNLIPSSPQSPVAYRILFTFTRFDDGRTLSRRSFAVSAHTGGPLSHIRVGKQIVVDHASVPIGLSVDAQLIARDGGVELQATISQTDRIPRSSGQTASDIRETHLQTATMMPEGKPVVLGVLDDLASKRRYRVEAVLTRQP